MLSDRLHRLHVRASTAQLVTGAALGTLLLIVGVPGGSLTDPRHLDTSCTQPVGEPDGPDGWGGCWPGPRTTGVPADTNLTRVPQQARRGPGWEWDSRDRILVVDAPDATITGLDVDGGLYIRGSGVVIQESRAKFLALDPGGPANFCHPAESETIRALTECTDVPGVSDDAAGASRAEPTVLEDSEIDYHGTPEDPGTCITGRNLTVRRTDVSGCENGVDADSYVTITDSYVHDLYNSATGDPHTDALQSGVGAHLVLEHNVFYGFTQGCTYPDDSGSCNGTSAINLGGQPDESTVQHTLVRRNLLAGGAYTLYCPTRAPRDFAVRQNWFSSAFSGTADRRTDRRRVGAYGPAAECGRPGVQATGNELVDPVSGRAVPLTLATG